MWWSSVALAGVWVHDPGAGYLQLAGAHQESGRVFLDSGAVEGSLGSAELDGRLRDEARAALETGRSKTVLVAETRAFALTALERRLKAIGLAVAA